MSGTTSDFDLREQAARIDHLREEALKLMAEQHKLTWESLKFEAEQRKLFEEALKLRRDRWLAPLLVIVSVLGAAGGLLSVLHAAGVF